MTPSVVEAEIHFEPKHSAENEKFLNTRGQPHQTILLESCSFEVEVLPSVYGQFRTLIIKK